jgi:hypothetical protein
MATVVLEGFTKAQTLPNLVARPIRIPHLATDNRARLLAVLAQARRRMAAATLHSPDWEAAAAGVDSLELELDVLGVDVSANQPPPRASGATTTLNFGPVNLPGDVTIRGTINGRADPAHAVRRLMRDLADGAATRQGFMRELERLATRNGFVVEVGVAGPTSITFYAWENQPPTP